MNHIVSDAGRVRVIGWSPVRLSLLARLAIQSSLQGTGVRQYRRLEDGLGIANDRPALTYKELAAF